MTIVDPKVTGTAGTGGTTMDPLEETEAAQFAAYHQLGCSYQLYQFQECSCPVSIFFWEKVFIHTGNRLLNFTKYSPLFHGYIRENYTYHKDWIQRWNSLYHTCLGIKWNDHQWR